MKQSNNAPKKTLGGMEAYLEGAREFSEFYLSTVIFSGCAAAAAIAVAIISSVLLGVALAILTAVVYVVFTSIEAKKQLGISYKNECGAITVTSAVAVYGNSIYLPEKFIWADLTRLEDGVFASSKNKSITKIYLPQSIEYIGKDIFGQLKIRPEIYYGGTGEQWGKIERHTDLSSFNVHLEAPLPPLPKKQRKKKPDGGEEK